MDISVAARARARGLAAPRADGPARRNAGSGPPPSLDWRADRAACDIVDAASRKSPSDHAGAQLGGQAQRGRDAARPPHGRR
eukprot:11813422-Alexandrium_andersonii.AAC.1